MNPYYEFDLPFLPATLARAEDLNTQFMAIETAFDGIQIDVDFADTKAQEAAASAVASAQSAAASAASAATTGQAVTNARNFAEQTGSDVDGFNGEYSSREWATGVFVPFGSALTWATRISGPIGGEYSAKAWATSSLPPLGSAKDWANRLGQVVSSGEYSSKEWAVGSVVPDGSSKEWSTQTGSSVDGVEFSSKEWATGMAVPSGSAKTWAFGTRAEGSARQWAVTQGGMVDGVDYSAKEWAIGGTVPAGSAKFWAMTAAGSANFRGPYDDEETYAIAEIVSLGGVLYMLSVPTSQGVSPPDSIWVPLSMAFTSLEYEQRGDLRTLEGPGGAIAVVDGLGIFEWQASMGIDDDETAFVSATGTWYMQATHPDVVFAHQIVEEEDQNARIEDLELGLSIGLSGQASTAAVSVPAESLVDAVASVPVAEVGDIVIATPRGPLGTAPSDQALLSLVAYVSAPGSVTVSIRNANASTAAALTAPTLIDVRVLKSL